MKIKFLRAPVSHLSSANLFAFSSPAQWIIRMAPDIRPYLVRHNKMREEHKPSKVLKKFTVSEILEKKQGFINPVIVTFQNGELNDRHAPRCNVNFTTEDSGKTKIEVETPSGHVFKDSHCNEQTQAKQIIAIRNKKTNKIKLVEVDHAILINSALLKLSKTNAPPISAGAEARTLNRTFGGKKVAIRLEQREKLNLSTLPIADDVKKAVEDIEVEENISLNKTENESILHLMPPCHRNATELADVYRIEEILSEAELKALQEEFSKIQEKSEFNSAEFSQFFLYCHSEVQKSKKNMDVRMAGILFIETLIKFLKMPSKRLTSKKVEVCSFSSIIQDKILNEFCIKTESSITRPQTMRDKAIFYIIAVCLICCNYQVNLGLLAKVTAVHLKRLTRLAQVVGAVPVSKDDSTFVLRIPLPALPKSSKGRVQRK